MLAALAASGAVWGGASSPRLTIPVHRVTNQRVQWKEEELRQFSSAIWDEAVRDLARCGIDLGVTTAEGEIKAYPSSRPMFVGLQRGKLNVVLTDWLPQDWDAGRAIAGISTVYEGYHVSAISLRYAHGHRIPFLAVNTVLHEVLHFLLLDVFVAKPGMLRAGWREERVDWHATRLWLSGGDPVVLESGQRYLQTLLAAGARASGNQADARDALAWIS
jgi:hypothetical protein